MVVAPVWTPSDGSDGPSRVGAILKAPRVTNKVEAISRERYLELAKAGERASAGEVYDRVFPPGTRHVTDVQDDEGGKYGSEEEDLLERMLGDELGMVEGGDGDNDEGVAEKAAASGSHRGPRAVVGDNANTGEITNMANITNVSTKKAAKSVAYNEVSKNEATTARVTRSTARKASKIDGSTTQEDRKGAMVRESPIVFTSIMTEEMKQDDALGLALAELKYESWSHLIETLLRRAGGHEALAEKIKHRDKETKREIKGGNVVLEDVFYRNGMLYDEKFARAYKAASKGLKEHLQIVDDAIALERHSKLTNLWSSLTPEEHSWYLTHQHQRLSGQDAEVLAELSARVEKERQAYRVEILRAYEEDHQRFKYEHMTDRQAGQLQNDDVRRRARVGALFGPDVLGIVGSINRREFLMNQGRFKVSGDDDNAFEFVSVLRVVGAPDTLSLLAPGHDLQGHKHYLPPVGPPSSETYTKTAAVEIDEDPIVAELLRELAESEQDTSTTFVATASAFHKLVAFDALSLDTSTVLDIPITKRNDTWFLHKPCMPRKLMVREKQRRIQKYAVLSASCQLPRREPHHTMYSLWRHASTGTRCIVRHRSIFRMAATGTGTAATVIFAVKPEYLPSPDREDQTPEEKATWDARLSLAAPLGARTLQLAHVNVANGRILSWETYHGARDIASERAGRYRLFCPTITRFLSWINENRCNTSSSPNTPVARFASVLSGAHWELYSATGEANMEPTKLLDIRAIHENSSATDVLSNPFVPPIWRQFSNDIAQIPDTFPPRRQAPTHTHINLTALSTHKGGESIGRRRGSKKRKAKGGARRAQGAPKIIAVPDDLDDLQGIQVPTGNLDYDDNF